MVKTTSSEERAAISCLIILYTSSTEVKLIVLERRSDWELVVKVHFAGTGASDVDGTEGVPAFPFRNDDISWH